ncbi:sugar ABC transporter ATP-binding protein, partial [Treponema saccharophilum]|uniref:sugar ABC transporter ATP-binding protein n=1 Tax=Treponema saccharophilum TaxID=165 RepID=UPI00386770C2
MENNDIVLSMRGIYKEFPGVKALQNVDFTLREAEIHALMGENGAGKSTLVKVLTGVHIKDAGEIRIAGNDGPVNIRSPQDAQNLGISTVYQEITLCPNLTVAENMYIGRGNYKFVNRKKQEKQATELLRHLNIPANASQQLGTCSLAVQQMVAIARAVDMDCKVLILDEPTSSLDDNEVELLFTLMRVLKSHGVGIIFITHFLEQVYEVCDKITVLRNGELVGEYNVSEMPRVKLISAMLGKDAEDMTNLKNMKRPLPNTENVYEATDLATTEGVRPFDFNIRKGEVNGFTGLLGSGRSESVRAVFAADRITSGKVKINGKNVKITSPKDAMKNGIGYLPEDRKGDGIIQDLSVRENMMLAMQVLRGFFHPISRAESERLADEYIKLLEI